MADGVMSIVYRQGLVWSGMVFAPVLPTIAILSNAVFFYAFLWIVRRTCSPPKKRWNQSRTNTMFMVALLITLILVMVPVHYSLRKYNPNCGPYESTDYTSVYGIIWNFIDVWSRSFSIVLAS